MTDRADRFLVDIDVLVDFLHGNRKAADFVNECASRIILSSIVVAELYAGVRGDAEQKVLKNLVHFLFSCGSLDG
jgi:predicted nucleic acid-binding protein